MNGGPCETPLVELLERVPEDARMTYEHGPTHHQMIPVGVHAKHAAEMIRSLESKLETVLKERVDAQIDRDNAVARAEMFERRCDAQQSRLDTRNREYDSCERNRQYWETEAKGLSSRLDSFCKLVYDIAGQEHVSLEHFIVMPDQMKALLELKNQTRGIERHEHKLVDPSNQVVDAGGWRLCVECGWLQKPEGE